ncbi:Transcriptional activator rfaH [Serratia fonticola]|uniref:Transcriptional activator rfaH n=1 Tax=Serratia fonticola TaxID=47917 RepID=A0A4U9WMF4_SERFO|nr:Transcriptional activator rfaH [Serratia fonticola]
MESWYLLYCKRGQLLRAQEHLVRQAVNCLSPIITLEKIVRGKRTALANRYFPTTCLLNSIRNVFTPLRSVQPVVSATLCDLEPYRPRYPLQVIEELQTHSEEFYVDPETPQPGDTVLITGWRVRGPTCDLHRT